jgi:hypothetical protein
MSIKGIESVLSRAMSDLAFADELFANPSKVLSDFDLTTEEVAKFKKMSRVEFDKFAKASPEERKSFSFFELERGVGPGGTNHNETILKIQ